MKKYFLIAFTVLLFFVLTACNSESPPSENNVSESPTVSPPVIPSSTPSPTPPPVLPSPTPSPTPPSAPPNGNGSSYNIEDLEWIELEFISIPTMLTYTEAGLHGSLSITGDILESKTGVWGDTWMYAGWLMGDYETLVEEAEEFIFGDGHIGIFMESFDWNIMGWIREDGRLVTLRHGGDISIFTDNEELILKIVRSLR